MNGTLLRRGAFLALVAAMCIWAATYEGPTHQEHPRSDAAAVDPTPALNPAAPSPSGAPPTSSRTVVPPRSTPRPDAGQLSSKGQLGDDERSPDRPGLTVGQARRRDELIADSRRRTALNEARYLELTSQWDREARDDSWAKPQEDDIREMLVDSGVDHMLMRVECRSSLCRVEAVTPDSHSIISFTAVPGLVEALGDEDRSAIGMDGNPGDRTLILIGPAAPR